MFLRSTLLITFLFVAGCGGNGGSTEALEPAPFPAFSDNQNEFLNDNSARENVVLTQTGLQYEVLEAAEGSKPTAQSNITVHYDGTLTNGTVFDSSYVRGEPATFLLSGTIAGWVEGLQLMSVGSKYRFVIPAELAYGDKGAGSIIKPGDALIFVVELLEIN